MFGLPIPAAKSEQPAEPDENIAVSDLAAAMPPRAVYKYSVIDGGVYTASELAEAIDRDSVVADHYRSIKAEAVRAETVTEDRLAYMSYRRGDHVYWTKHKVRLKQGETILTDGSTQVRSRCGNCISLAPMEPTAPDEPEIVEFEALTNDPGVAVPPEPITILTAPPSLLPLPGFVSFPLDSFGPVPIATMAENLPDIPGETPPPQETLAPPPPGVIPLPPGAPVPDPPSDNPPPRGNPPPTGDPPVVTIPPPFEPPVDPPEIVPPGGDPPETPEEPIPTPEPATLLLVGSGAALMARKLRTKSRH